MNRRGFLGAILAAGAAPAIIKVENAMRLWVPRRGDAWWLGMQWSPEELARMTTRVHVTPPMAFNSVHMPGPAVDLYSALLFKDMLTPPDLLVRAATDALVAVKL